MSYARGEADVIAGVNRPPYFQKFYLTLILMGCSQFADGHSYSKNKMDEILRSGALDKLPPRQKENHPHVKREDVELIVSRKLERADSNEELTQTQVHELEIPKSQAEKALNEAGGDVLRALKMLITPKKDFGSEKPLGS